MSELVFIFIQMAQIDEELRSLCWKREQLLGETSERAQDCDELESLRAVVTSVTEERNQLQEILQGLREDCGQLKIDLDEGKDTVSLGFNNKRGCNACGRWNR